MILSIILLYALLGYVIGSVSSAILICRLCKLPDPRTIGSKNPGATNVMRLGGKKAAAMTLIGDFLKGVVAVMFAALTIRNEHRDTAMATAGLGAFLGHLYPLYFGFKGGKGVATLAGVLSAISPVIIGVFLLCWLAVFYVFGYSSLASMTATIITAVTAILLDYPRPVVVLLMLLSALVLSRHRTNISRLLNGTEKSFKKKR